MAEIFASKVTYFNPYFLIFFPKLHYIKTFQRGSAQCACAELSKPHKSEHWS